MKKYAIAVFMGLAMSGCASPQQDGVTYDTAMRAYDNGNFLTALRGFRMISERGPDHDSDASQIMLGEMYEKGLGTPQDDAQAYFWYYLVADEPYEGNAGSKTPAVSVSAHNAQIKKAWDALDVIAKKLSPDQISKAQKLAREWEKNHQK